MMCAVILMSIGLGRMDFRFADFGVLFLFFSTAAYWPEMTVAIPEKAWYRLIDSLKSTVP